jgi:hypothetical protein
MDLLLASFGLFGTLLGTIIGAFLGAWAVRRIGRPRPIILVDTSEGTSRITPAEVEATLERVMNLGENRIEMRIPRSVWFP